MSISHGGTGVNTTGTKVENGRISTSNYRLFSRGASSPESPIYTPIFFFNSRAPGPEWWQKEGWGSSRCFQDLVYATWS